MQAQRLQMKLYKHLQLQPDQRSALADRWHSWIRRRFHLDKKLNAAVLKLTNLLEASQNLATAALKLVDAAASVTSSEGTQIMMFECDQVPPEDRASLGSGVRTLNSPGEGSDHVYMHEAHDGSVENQSLCTDATNAQVREDVKKCDSDSGEETSFQFWLPSRATSMVVDPRIFLHSTCVSKKVRSQQSTGSSPSLILGKPARRQENIVSSTEATACDVVGYHSTHVKHASGASTKTLHYQSFSSASEDTDREGFSSSVQSSCRSCCEGCEDCEACQVPVIFREGAGVAWCRNAYVTCTGCGSVTQVRARLLGESGDMLHTVHEALDAISEVHKSDELMHFEFLKPFGELSEVRVRKYLLQFCKMFAFVRLVLQF